jgi:hypothetical protein
LSASTELRERLSRQSQRLLERDRRRGAEDGDGIRDRIATVHESGVSKMFASGAPSVRDLRPDVPVGVGEVIKRALSR